MISYILKQRHLAPLSPEFDSFGDLVRVNDEQIGRIAYDIKLPFDVCKNVVSNSIDVISVYLGRSSNQALSYLEAKKTGAQKLVHLLNTSMQ